MISSKVKGQLSKKEGKGGAISQTLLALSPVKKKSFFAEALTGKDAGTVQREALASLGMTEDDLKKLYDKRKKIYSLADFKIDCNNKNKDDFDNKFGELIDLVNNNAPVKIICSNKKESEIISIFDEVKNEIEQIELRKKIESLEDKVSMNLDEKLYSELISLRNQLKSR